ncbi:MAG: prepilin peptidase [bacterium]|nr:prepilin peptidase [bacterium]
MESLILFWFFVLGAVIGSFLNVCIFRIPKKLSIISPPSFCPQCDRKIKPLENIPILSYIFLKGKCRGCSSEINLRYPVVEFISGSLTLFVVLRSGYTVESAIALLFIYIGITIFYIDIDHGIIPDPIVIFGTAAVFLFQITGKHLEWTDFVYGAAAGAGFLLFTAKIGDFLFKKPSMGGGDIKFGLVMGLFLGLQNTIVGLFTAFILAAVIGISLKMIHGDKPAGEIPFGPYLVMGSLTALFYGNIIAETYLKWVGLR